MSPSRPPIQNRLLDLEAELFGQRFPVGSRQVKRQERKTQIPQQLAIGQSTPQFPYTQLVNRLRGSTITSRTNQPEQVSASTQLSHLMSHSISYSMSGPMARLTSHRAAHPANSAIEPRSPDRFLIAELEPVLQDLQSGELQSDIEPEIIHLATRIIKRQINEEPLTLLVPMPGRRILLSQPIPTWQPNDQSVNIDRLRRCLIVANLLEAGSLALPDLIPNVRDDIPQQDSLSGQNKVASPELQLIKTLMVEVGSHSLNALPPEAHLWSGPTIQPLLPSAQSDEPGTVQPLPKSMPVFSQEDFNQNPDLTL